jgi:hypothetical protein
MLGHPLTPTPILYRPLRAIPLWPNNDIFGGYDNVTADFDPKRFDPKYYNRIAEDDTVPREHDIRRMPIKNYAFGPNYAWRRFAALKNHVAANYLALLSTSEVFRGDEVFALWMIAVSKGVICGDASQLEKGEPVADCGFSRVKESGSRQTTIEYCGFGRFAESGASDSPLCIEVAKKNAKRISVLASPYVFYGQFQETGGAEGTLFCFFEGKTADELKERVGQFLTQYLGDSRKYVTRAQSRENLLPPLPSLTSYSFKGEGLRIRDDQEHLFKRVYVTGNYGQANMSVQFSATISVHASDNIIDYREPNEAMGNRLRNRFFEKISELSRDISPRSKCEE